MRARPSRARLRAGTLVTSLPNISTVLPRREVAGYDVEKRRLPRAVRPEDRSPLAGRDVEVDVVDGEEPAEPPADPRKRRVGSACSTAGAASVTDLLDDLVRDDAVLDDPIFPATEASASRTRG